MKKSFVLLIAVAISLFAINAQTPQAYEGTANFDKKTSGNCVSIKVPANVKDAQNIMSNLLKNYGLKGKISGKTSTYEKVAFEPFSTDYINLYISFDETSKSKDNPFTTVNMFVTKGVSTTFESSGTDASLIGNEKNFLNTKYYQEIYNNNVALKIDAKKKEIEQTQKQIDDLNKRIDNLNKAIIGYQKDIEKANNNITKAKSDIQKAQQSTEAAKTILAKQQAELKQIK